MYSTTQGSSSYITHSSLTSDGGFTEVVTCGGRGSRPTQVVVQGSSNRLVGVDPCRVGWSERFDWQMTDQWKADAVTCIFRVPLVHVCTSILQPQPLTLPVRNLQIVDFTPAIITASDACCEQETQPVVAWILL